MDRVKMGVIGLGWFGVKHCEALAAIPLFVNLAGKTDILPLPRRHRIRTAAEFPDFLAARLPAAASPANWARSTDHRSALVPGRRARI